MTPRITAVLGKGGAGKTFVAANLAMALGYIGVKTLVVGCDQKQDLTRALSPEHRHSLMDWLAGCRNDPGQVPPEEVLLPRGEYVDVLELGAAPILTGHYGAVIDEAFRYLGTHQLLERYEIVLFDVNEERWDATGIPLYQRATHAIAVTQESPESLFVLNRMLRALQIGAWEQQFPIRVLGAINNASRDPSAFQRFCQRVQCAPLLTVPDLAELAALKPAHRTLFSLDALPEHLLEIQDGFVKIADLLRGTALNVMPVATLNDEEIWELAPPVSLPS